MQTSHKSKLFRYVLLAILLIVIGFLIREGRVFVRGENPWMAMPGDFRLTPAFPDTASRYDLFVFQPETGDFDALKVTGDFPYARYFSFNLYDYQAATDFDALADKDIVPDEGVVNPFRIGVNRQASNRSYTLWLIKEGTPFPDEAVNVLTYPPDIEKITLMTRVYRPDEGKDSLGGVPHPELQAVKLDGSRAVMPNIGADIKDLRKKLDMFLMNSDLISTWKILKDYTGESIVFFRISDAGLFPNAHNEYIMSPLEDHTSAKIAVINLKKVPTFEDTYTGKPLEGGKEVRYWSFCIGGLGETGTPDCLCDDQVQKNGDGSVTIIIAPFYLKKDIEAAGLNYMRWGLVYKPIIIHRHMMARDNFEGSIGQVVAIGRPPEEDNRNRRYLETHEAGAWMGDYTPQGRIYTKEDFLKGLAKGDFNKADSQDMTFKQHPPIRP